MKRFSHFLLFIFLFGLNYSAFAQGTKLPEGVKKITTVEGITEYQLNNGLRVLLFPDQSKPTITVNITYLVGSRHEGYGETGMAHLLEHLVFKGTPKHKDIPKEFKERGASWNGTTWYDRTNYFETFPANDENLAWALDLESDRMVNSFIAKSDLDSEMSVVRNEFESGENYPSNILLQRVLSTAYLWHNYGQSTIGARSDIENVPIERLQAFYRRYYQPNNSVLLVAGKIDEAKTIEMVQRYFGGIPRSQEVVFPTYTKEPTQDGERMVTLRRTGDVQVVSCMYHTPPGAHEDYAAIAIIDELLTNEPSGRVYKALVESKKASLQWSFAPSLKEGGFLYVSADVRKENSIEEAKQALLSAMDSLTINPPTPEEVERAKARILKILDLAYKNTDRVGLTMSEYIAQGDWRLFFLNRDRIEAVTLEDVVQVAKKYFKPDNRTIGMFFPTSEPQRAEIPDAPNIAELVANYKGREAISAGETFDPTPANIDARTIKGETENGIKFAFLPKENRGDAVTAYFTFRFGNEEVLKNKMTVGSLAASMLDKGTKNRTRQQIQDELDKINATLRISGSGSIVSARIETEYKHLPAVVKLLSEILKEPAFDEAEFTKLVEERLADLEQNLSDPMGLANDKFTALLSPYPKTDIRYNMTMEEQIEAIKKVKLEDVKAFYKDVMGTAKGGANISIVGDFDEEAVKATIIEQLKDWNSPVPYKRIDNPFIANKAENVNIEAPDKPNAMFLAGVKININDQHPDYPALMLGNYMLGGGGLSSRLADRIRQKEGLSYGVGSFFNASSLDESATLGGYAIYAPENRDAVEKAFREEIEKVLKEGFTEEEVALAKKGWLESQNLGRAQDRSLVGKFDSNLFLNRTMMWDAAMEEKVSKLTPEQINAAMKKHVDLNKMTFVKAGDFAGAEKKKSSKP
jgi:zinc protease